MPVSGELSTPWQLLPADLADALGARLAPTVDAVARNVSESVPAFAAIEDPKFQRDVHAVQVAVERFLDLIGTPTRPAAEGPRDVRRARRRGGA